MRLDDEPGQTRGGRPASGGNPDGKRDARNGGRPGNSAPKSTPAPANSAFADALARAAKR
jgi:uncharacterized protein